MLLLKIIIYYIFTGLLFSLILDKELEESIPILFIIDGIIISITSYLNNVYLGIYVSVYILPIVFLLLTIYLSFKKIINIKDILKKITIKSVCIVLLFTYAYLLSKNTYISIWDEYRFWGARTFDMLKNGALITQAPFASSTGYLRYPLFFSSVQCLFCYLGGGYQEPILYFANTSFCFSLFLYIIPKIKISKSFEYLKLILYLLLIAICGICITKYEAASLYDCIYVDYPTALFAAFVFYLAYSLEIKNKKELMIFSISIIGLLMSKQIGLIFACLIIVFIILNNIKFNNKKKLILFVLFIIVTSIICLVALNYAIGLSTLDVIVNSITHKDMWERKIGILFLEYLFKKPTSPGIISLPYLYYLIISCSVFLIINCFNRKNAFRKKNIRLSIILFIGGILWIFAQLYFMYRLANHEITSDNILLPSYHRYMGTYLFMIVITLFMVSVDNINLDSKFLSLILPFSLLLCVNYDTTSYLVPSKEPSGIITNQKTLKIINMLDNVPEESKVLIVEQYSDGYFYSGYIDYYYYMYDMYKPFTNARFGKKDYNSQGALDYSLEEYISCVSEYDYLYMLFPDEQYIERYWNPSTDSDLFVNGLYKIDKTNTNKLDLEFVGYFE